MDLNIGLNRMLLSIFVTFCALIVSAQTNQDDAIDLLLKRIEGLSETTSPEGLGADAYGGFLTTDFSRWTLGDSTIVNDKSTWIAGIRGWFNDGWRVAEREQRIVEISIVEEFAFVRRVVFETYMGPDGSRSKSSAALSEVWLRKDGIWYLYRVNVHPW